MGNSNTTFKPLNPLKSPRFGEVATFCRLPHIAELENQGIDVAILGVPFDGGATFRPGARFGPRAVREASVLNRNYHPTLGVHIYETLNVVDGGDISVNPINLQNTMASIEAHVSKAHRHGIKTICVGGDHSIILPELRAIHKTHGQVVLIHFDAHTDTADSAWGEKYHHGTPIRRAIEEGLLDGKKIFQIGIRGPLTSATQEDFTAEQGIHTLDIDAFHDTKKRDDFFQLIRKTAGTSPCFLTFDIDSIDPAYAPGTGTPVVGGLTSYEALNSVRKLKGLNLVGANLVEISPPYDHAEITSLLGAALLFEFLGLIATSATARPGAP